MNPTQLFNLVEKVLLGGILFLAGFAIFVFINRPIDADYPPTVKSNGWETVGFHERIDRYRIPNQGWIVEHGSDSFFVPDPKGEWKLIGVDSVR